MDTLTSIRAFKLVSESKNFTAVAKQMCIFPAMVSKHISGLEKRLDTRLLNRTSRNVSLIESGAIYLERISNVIEDLDAAELQLKNASQSPGGFLKVSAPVWVVCPTFTEMLNQFHNAYPDIRLELDLSGQKMNLVDEG